MPEAVAPPSAPMRIQGAAWQNPHEFADNATFGPYRRCSRVGSATEAVSGGLPLTAPVRGDEMDVETIGGDAFGVAVPDAHPRARGFKVLSRLARGESAPGRRVSTEPVGTVVALERATHAPRHRLDIESELVVSLSS